MNLYTDLFLRRQTKIFCNVKRWSYQVFQSFVDDDFHYMDESERYKKGKYDSNEIASNFAIGIIISFWCQRQILKKILMFYDLGSTLSYYIILICHVVLMIEDNPVLSYTESIVVHTSY